MESIEVNRSRWTGIDFLFLASGADSRAYEILQKIDLQKTTVVFFHFKERIESLDLTNATSFYRYKNLKYSNIVEISCEIKAPSSCLNEILAIHMPANAKIGIDISCFTKPYFYFLLKLLKERYKIANILAYYTEPKSYIFDKGMFNNFHSSSGPLSIYEIPGFSGLEKRDTMRQLVILLGFDGDLSKEINEDVSPHQTVIINGFPAYTPKFKDISLIANEKLVCDCNIRLEYCLANNPFDTYNLLHKIKNSNKTETFFNIAPLGTKPMALGACLFALHNPEVRIVYPLPENYENKYSTMCSRSWMYQLPL